MIRKRTKKTTTAHPNFNIFYSATHNKGAIRDFPGLGLASYDATKDCSMGARVDWPGRARKDAAMDRSTLLCLQAQSVIMKNRDTV